MVPKQEEKVDQVSNFNLIWIKKILLKPELDTKLKLCGEGVSLKELLLPPIESNPHSHS